MALTLKHRGITNMPALRAGSFRGYLDRENRYFVYLPCLIFVAMGTGHQSVM